jgi:imidazolonepropionase
VGRLAPGYQADVLVLDASDWRYLAYHLGGDRLATRIKSGQPLGSNYRLL